MKVGERATMGVLGWDSIGVISFVLKLLRIFIYMHLEVLFVYKHTVYTCMHLTVLVLNNVYIG